MPDKEKISSFVRAAQKGDDLAFTELVRAYQDIAVAYAASILRDYHLAEDAAQEAFVEAHRALPELREPAAFGAWFRAILYKYCDRMTRRKRRPITGLEAALEVASPAPSPHETLESRETQKSVRAAIATLSDIEQQVVLLYYMGEHSTAMIAEFLNVTANTIKTRLYSARNGPFSTYAHADLGPARAICARRTPAPFRARTIGSAGKIRKRKRPDARRRPVPGGPLARLRELGSVSERDEAMTIDVKILRRNGD